MVVMVAAIAATATSRTHHRPTPRPGVAAAVLEAAAAGPEAARDRAGRQPVRQCRIRLLR
jgi:hypothetical protein